MSNYFFKPELESLSQGAKLKFLRELRYMKLTDVAEYLNLGSKSLNFSYMFEIILTFFVYI